VQKFWSILFGVTMLGCLLLFIIAPWVGWWLPPNVATFGPSVDNLFYLILAITGFFFILTEGILVYGMWRFAGAPGRRGIYVHGNHTLELIWTIVPAVVLLLVAIVQIQTWANIKFQKNMPAPDGTTEQMEVTARQWEWRVRYPSSERMASWERDPKAALDFGQNPHLDDLHTVNEIHVWKGVKVLVHLKTQDVIHSFFLPNLRLKQDALPGKTIPVWFELTDYNTEQIPGQGRWAEVGYDPKTGKTTQLDKIWELACAEFCGVRHSMMRGKLYVHKDKADFLAWLKQAEADQNRYQPPATPARVAAR
jgi:cytochrome c oxidase subunit 2